MKYRVEDKYLITEDQIAYLQIKLKECMEYDSNMSGDSYLIRSIYFDDMFNSCMEENESGVDEREKYRIRSYNCNSDFLRLELKGKHNGYTHKESTEIKKELVEKYMMCTQTPADIMKVDVQIDNQTPELLKRLWVESRTRLMSPVNIVEYERTAFVESRGNVRITFDKNIGYSNDCRSFFDKDMETIPVLPTGVHILEVKYDEFIPDYIRTLLDTGRLSRTSFSKYYFSRANQMLI